MSEVYLVKDGIINVGFISKNKEQVKNTNFFLITIDFKTNFGYVQKRKTSEWRLYTSIGQLMNKKRYYHFDTLVECINKLKVLKGDDKVSLINSNEVVKYL